MASPNMKFTIGSNKTVMVSPPTENGRGKMDVSQNFPANGRQGRSAAPTEQKKAAESKVSIGNAVQVPAVAVHTSLQQSQPAQTKKPAEIGEVLLIVYDLYMTVQKLEPKCKT